MESEYHTEHGGVSWGGCEEWCNISLLLRGTDLVGNFSVAWGVPLSCFVGIREELSFDGLTGPGRMLAVFKEVCFGDSQSGSNEKWSSFYNAFGGSEPQIDSLWGSLSVICLRMTWVCDKCSHRLSFRHVFPSPVDAKVDFESFHHRPCQRLLGVVPNIYTWSWGSSSRHSSMVVK